MIERHLSHVLRWRFFDNSGRRTGKQSGLPAYDEQKEGEHMEKNKLPIVHCSYCDTGRSLSEILEESFRLYLNRILGSLEKPAAQNKR